MRKLCRYIQDPTSQRMFDMNLAVMIGDRAAIFIQQVHYRSVWKEEQCGSGEWRSSLSEWAKEFPCWSAPTIKRLIKDCRDMGVLRLRKGTFRGRKAVWFSLDYDKIDELGDAGYAKLSKSAPVPAEELVKDQIDPEEEINLISLHGSKRSDYMGQIDRHLRIQHNKITEAEITTPALAADAAHGEAHTPRTLEALQAKINVENLVKFKKRFEQKQTVQTLEKLWEMMVVDRFGRKGFTPLTAADRKNTKDHFIKFCEQAGIPLIDLLSFCVTEWEALRDHRMKGLKLGDTPSYRTIFALKDRFLEQYRKNGKEAESPTKARVFTSVAQIPKGHPQYAILKGLVERTGRAMIS